VKPHPLFRHLALVPIFLLLVAIPVAFYFSSGKSYENAAVLLLLLFVCSFSISLLIVYFLSRIFLVQGPPGFVLLASGVLVWGIAGFVGVIAGITGKSVYDVANNAITIHNCSVLISALLHLTGTIFLIRPGNINRNRRIVLVFSYFFVLLLSGIICISTLNGWIPLFFIEQSGGTLLRQCVLASSIAMFFATSVMLWWHDRKSNSFIYWYALSLVLIQVGLFGVMIQPVHGGVVSWIGRSAQFLSGPYMLAAVVLSYRESRLKGISLEEALIGWKSSKEALRQSEERFRFLFTNTSNGIAFHEVITDKMGKAFDYRVLDVNQSFEQITGFKAASIIGKTMREVLPGIENDLVDWIGKYDRVALFGEQICFEEFSQVFKKWFHVTAFQITPGKLVTIFEDVTVRKENELQLEFGIRCSEERFRALVETSSNIIFRMSPDWSKMRQLQGNGVLEENDTADNDWLQRYIPPQEHPHIIAAINEAIATRNVLKLEHRVCKSDGSTGWASSQAVPLIDDQGNVYEWFGTSTDISERKKSQEVLQKNEALLRAVTDNNRDPIYMKDRKSRLLFANPATLKLIGKPAEEVIGKTDEEFSDNPSDGRAIMENDRRIIESGCAEVIEETVSSGSGSSIRTFISSKAPWYDEQGQIIGIVGMSHEITERKVSELALKRRTEELDAANKDLESFSYSVSHDLRSQLNNIKCLSQILLEKYSDGLSKDDGNFVKRISVSTDKMAQIIDGMLGLARLTRESMICHHIDLVPIINAVFYELRQTDPGRIVEICIDPELTAYADARLMHIALFNLIENAWKYSSKNPQARIEIGTLTMENEQVFFIRDNGAGFNMKHAGKLFEPFQRLHSDNHFPGTGIGLATVSKIIHRHSGKIWAESFVGEGTTFYFTVAQQQKQEDKAHMPNLLERER
jgi:PAS domain S-box-containing protein